MKLGDATSRADWARHYIETLHLALVCIPPGQKAPKGNGWNKPGGYITDADQAAAFWAKHPNHNMGVVLGPSRICSLDVDHVEYSRQVLRDVLDVDLDKLAEENPTLVGNPERFRIMFRMPEGLEFNRHSLSWPNPLDPDGSKHKLATAALKRAREAGDKEQVEAMQARQRKFAPVTVFELRAGAVQDVLPPSIHPETGQPYTWRNPPADGLPELPSDLVKTWQLWDIFKRTALEACPWALAASKLPARVKKISPIRKDAGDHPSVIDVFNRATAIETLLQRHGYIKRGSKWLAPQSSTGMPGVCVVDEQGEPRLYSHHGSDPLANGHMNDAFDVFCILEHNGDTGAAIKAAARELRMEHKHNRSAPRLPMPPLGDDLPSTPSADEAAASAGSSDNGGQGAGFTAEQILRRFALVEGTTHVWDQDKKAVMKKTAFEALVTKTLAKAWADDVAKKLIGADTVRELEQARRMAGKKATALGMTPIDRYVYIDGTKDVWDREKKRRIPEGAVKMALGDAYALWLNSAERRTVDVDHIVFDPTMTKDPAVYINTFEGLPLEPVRDDAACENLRWLISFLCNHEAEPLDWLVKWLAFPLQHPGAKLDTAVLMHSVMEGSGKSLLFADTFGALYGPYAATVGQTQLESNFNAWQSRKLWAVFEEVVSRDQRYNQVGKIKHLITGKTVRMESKFINGWEEANHMNAVFLSNEILPWPISESDRRFLVMWPLETLPEERQRAIGAELANGGVAALYGWLLDVDLGDFNERTRPPHTDARQRLVALSRAGWQTFLHQWQHGELGQKLWGACLSTDLYALFLEWCQRNREHAMSQTKFSLFISSEVEKTRSIPWTEGANRRFGAFFFPSDPDSSLPPSMNAAALGQHVAGWRAKAKLAGWDVDGWDHLKGAAA